VEVFFIINPKKNKMKHGKIDEEKKDSLSQNADTASLQKTVEMLAKKLEQMEVDRLAPVAGAGGFTVEQMLELLKRSRPAPTGHHLDPEIFYKNDIEYNLGPDDYDEVGVLFTAPSTGIVIYDDIRRGVAMRTPSRKELFFMYEGQVQSRDERGKAVLNTFSCYLSRSKAEQQWLREHTLYGILFAESGKKTLSMNSMRMQKMQAYMLGVSNLDNAALFARCKQAGLPVSKDVISMRFALAEKQLDDYEASTENAGQRAAKEKAEEEKFLYNPGAATTSR
jgi:hypothetical protein